MAIWNCDYQQIKLMAQLAQDNVKYTPIIRSFWCGVFDEVLAYQFLHHSPPEALKKNSMWFAANQGVCLFEHNLTV